MLTTSKILYNHHSICCVAGTHIQFTVYNDTHGVDYCQGNVLCEKKYNMGIWLAEFLHCYTLQRFLSKMCLLSLRTIERLPYYLDSYT